ncbi:MAG: carbon starvation protein A [Endomicrobiia bacterium]
MTIYIFSVLIIFVLGYIFYGKFLEKSLQIKFDEEVPSKKFYDGVDFVPTNKFVLLGHHFSSIAGAGPIVGPILAGLSFGWLAALLWIVLGTIFIGAVHDFSSVVVSIRHKGWSVAQVANKYINKTTYKIFLLFIWLALVYVVAVFADLASETFQSEPSVAQISIFYILIAILFGILLYKIKVSLVLSTIFCLVSIIIGIFFNINNNFLFFDKTVWIWILLIYSFLASILPVWFLLQPRDYLSSYFLYFTLIIGLVGLIFGKNKIIYPYFISFNSKSLGPIIPFMFITIACGAISGFHSLVSSGTTSKQIDNIKNARFVSYGGMILEGIVAAVALSTVMILSKNSQISSPQRIYALGISKFASLIGIKQKVGEIVGYLAISAFILTTLDTATRIARYVFQEIIERVESSIITRIIATLISLILPVIFLNFKLQDLNGNIVACWKIIWPLFGITNQLLAGLVFLVIYVWVRKQNYKNSIIIFLPMIFMLTMTLLALGYTLYVKIINLGKIDVITVSSSVLFLLSLFVIFESVKTFSKEKI